MNNDHMELTLHPSATHRAASAHPFRLMLAMVPSGELTGQEAMASTDGYVLQHGEPHELLAAIHALAEGLMPRPERIARKVTVRMMPQCEPAPDMIALSPRETEVLRGMVEGLSYKMVAHKLGISFETVRTHVKNVYGKLGVCNCTEAVSKALKTGLVK